MHKMRTHVTHPETEGFQQARTALGYVFVSRAQESGTIQWHRLFQNHKLTINVIKGHFIRSPLKQPGDLEIKLPLCAMMRDM